MMGREGKADAAIASASNARVPQRRNGRSRRTFGPVRDRDFNSGSADTMLP